MKYNLKIICKTANALHKAGYSRSQAFVFAWAMEKQGAAVKVKGVTKENRQAALQHLRRYDPRDVSVRLQREPGNLYDDNAVAVVAAVRGRGAYKMGYLPRAAAVALAPLMDAGKAISSDFQGVRGGFLPGINYGLSIQVKITAVPLGVSST